MSVDVINCLEKWIVAQYQPHLTLLLDIDPELGFKRAQKRNQHLDRIEQENLSFFSQVRQAYLYRAKEYPERISVIDASRDFESVQAEVKSILDQFIGNHKK